MRVHVNKIADEPEPGRVRLWVAFGSAKERQYLADCDVEDPLFKSFNVDEELFMRLSDLAYEMFCDSTLFHIEMMEIIQAHIERKCLRFPMVLGLTAFASKIPSPLTVLWRRIRRPFYSWWSWWRLRHVRRHNLEMLKTHGTLFPNSDDDQTAG